MKFFRKSVLIILISGLALTSCLDDPLNLETFKEDMAGEFLQKQPDQFSEFIRLLDTTEVLGLVNAYGEYTIFAPTNQAMLKYYQSKGKKSLSDFDTDTLRKIAFDHIIKGYVVTTDEFIDGLLPFLTMSDRYVSTTSKTESGSLYFYVNDKSKILSRNNEVNNGVVHIIENILDPSNLSIVQAIANDEKFKIFNQAMYETGLHIQLLKTRDETYDVKYWEKIYTEVFVQGGGSIDELPLSRKFGFTVLMESDETYRKLGINNLSDLKKWAAKNVYYENASDSIGTTPKDPGNSLYRFVSYHMINKKLTYNQFIEAYDTQHMIKTYDMYEYIETMCPNTLIEVKLERGTVGANPINKISDTGTAIRIVLDYKDKDAINGVYHEIDGLLVYSKDLAQELSGKRLRMDAASFFPELTNNNMRYYDPSKPRSWVFPKGYIERLVASSTTRFCYLNAYGGYLDYQGDEIYLKGMYDFSMETPPVPAGTYEIRFGYQPTGGRGAAQLYWDGVPCGIPLDLRILANEPLIGWVDPGTDPEDQNGFENDKMMRNRGYMKGPSTYKDILGVWYGKKIARNSPQYLRRILGTYTFDKTERHKFTVKAVREGQFMMDFLEFVPLEVIENEDVE